jgi:hypothetical protein|tara:strand:+ start:827 stop:1642 length:816 start_codon:yes stop_codon:yes gene_type:complete
MPYSEYQPIILNPQLIEIFSRLRISDSEGRVFSNKRRKYRQVEAFSTHMLKLLAEAPEDARLTLVDFACGKSYVSFYVQADKKVKQQNNIEIIGVDEDGGLVTKCNKIAGESGYDNMHFYASSIADFNLVGEEAPFLAYALHACDTASDDAIAKAVEYGSRHILIAPCCASTDIKQIKAPGIKGELSTRLGETVVNSMRGLILEYMGYDVSISEFISQTNTPRNIMIAGHYSGRQNPEAWQKYEALKEMFGVERTPMLEQYLAPRLEQMAR